MKRGLVALAAFAGALFAAEFGWRIWLAARGTPYDGSAIALRIGTLHSAFADALPKQRRVDDSAGATDEGAASVMLHPFFGYEFVGAAIETERDTAYFKSSEAVENYDVIVLGGSVAGCFMDGGADGLRAVLEADPRFASRRVRVFGQGRAAYKQPQQLHVLESLFGLGWQPDAVISLDGFNEVAVALQNARENVAPVYPYSSTWIALSQASDGDPAVLECQIEMRTLNKRVIAAAERFALFQLHRSALLGTLGLRHIEELRGQTLAARQALMQARHPGNRRTVLQGPAFAQDDRTLLQGSVRVWFECTRSMHAMCSARQIDFLEVLQPTLHDEGSKPLTPKEIEGGKAFESWVVAVHEGYPLLRAGGEQLAALGVPWFDSTRVFAQSKEDLYYDACHFSADGGKILGEAIARRLLAEFDRSGSKPARSH